MIGHVKRLYPEEHYGWVATGEGDEYLFHRTDVRGISFEDVRVGMRVDFLRSSRSSDDEVGEEPRAVFVRPAPEEPHAAASPTDAVS